MPTLQKTDIVGKILTGYKVSHNNGETFYSKKMGDTTYTSGSLERLKEMCESHQETNEELTALAIKEFGSTT